MNDRMVEPHGDNHGRRGDDPLTSFYKEVDDTNALITSVFGTVFLTLGTHFTDITALQASVAGLGMTIKQVQYTYGSSTSDTSFKDIVTVPITTSGGNVFVLALGAISEQKTGQDNFHHSYRIVRDSTVFATGASHLAFGGDATNGFFSNSSATLLAWDTDKVAGTYTWRIQSIYDNVLTNGTPTSSGTIFVAEIA